MSPEKLYSKLSEYLHSKEDNQNLFLDNQSIEHVKIFYSTYISALH